MIVDAKCPHCAGPMEQGVLMVPGSGPLQFVGQEAFAWLDGDFRKAAVRTHEVVAMMCPECGLVELRTKK